MLVLRDLDALAQVEDPQLRTLLVQRSEALLAEFGDDFHLRDLVTFVVVGAGDSREALDAQLGFPVLTHPVEVFEEHAGYYELVFVLSDDGFGIEVFIPKSINVPPDLLAMCTAARESPE